MRRCASALAGAALLCAVPASAAVDAPRPPRPPAGAELRALSQPPVRTSIASQRVYFVLPDRYANGNPGNDRGGRAGGRGVTGFDPADSSWFHGGDLAGLTGGCTSGTGLARIRDLGFTAVWVTPPYGQRAVQGDSAAYHGYWITDFTGVDPHLGTEAEFAAFVACAHRLGMKVYLDVVVNHTADVVQPTGGTTYLSRDEVPYRDCRGRAFDPARYARGRTFPCLSARTMPRVPVVLAAQRAVKRPAWLNDPLRYHNRGDIDFSSCSEECFEHGDFFGLDDLFTEQPRVADGLAAIYADWIRRYRVDGFRVDTARHVNEAFFRRWVPRIRAAARQAGVPDFEIFGEVFDANALNLVPFVRERGLPNVLDFAFQDAATRFASGDAGPGGLVSRLADDDYFAGANGVAHTPPTFLGNHDMGRAALKIKERSQASGEELLRRVLLGHDLLYLLRGAPVVYYGDEVGMLGSGGDKAARQDMFPTGVPEWRTEERVGSGPIGAGSSLELVHPIGSHLRALGRLRDEHHALSTGPTVVRLARDRVFAVSRFDAASRREYVAVFNAGAASVRPTLATATPASSWTPLLGASSAAVTGADGALTIDVPALTAVLYRAEAEVRRAPLPRPSLSVGRDAFSDLWRVRATLVPSGGSVTLAVRRAGAKRWARLAADDSPPYRAFLDPGRFKRNERVHLVAVARALDGGIAVSKVVPFTVRR